MKASSAALGITLRGVSKRYRIYASAASRLSDALWPRAEHADDHTALASLDLSFEAGERVGIIGFNGSGKTTLLKLMAGLCEPSSGSVEVRGRVTALFSHGSAFRPELTGRDNIHKEAALLGMTAERVEQKLDEIVEFSELGPAIDAPLHTYSTGMKARLGLSVMAQLEAEVLLIDEVLSGGDLYFQEKAFGAMRALCARGKLVIIVSHDMEVILRACDRVLWLHQGVVIADGSPWEVCWRYYREVFFEHWHRLNPEVVEEARALPPGALRGHLLNSERRWGSGELRFTGVRCLDGEGNEQSRVAQGQDLTLRLEYEAQVALPAVALIVDLRNPTQRLLASAWSALEDISFEVAPGLGYFEVTFPDLRLPAGPCALNYGAYPAEDGRDFSRYYAHHSILLGNEHWLEVIAQEGGEPLDPEAAPRPVLPCRWEFS
jgi:ABC-type polysaccharide/polyol phosphate transport system ATPase subunit